MFKTRHALPGTAPATLSPFGEGEAEPTVIHLTEFSQGEITERIVSTVGELPDLNLKDGKTRWIEFNGLADIEALRALGEKYQLHPLALEDVLHTGQRPKADAYENQLFIVTQMLYRDEEQRLCGEQVAMFLSPCLLITIQEDDERDVFEPVRERLRVGRGWIRKLGSDYLAYALLDSIIDHCFPILECLGEALEELEDELLSKPNKACVARLHEFRRTLVHLRRVIWPERDLINTMLHDESRLISKQTKVFLRDAYDHAIRIMDLIESYRDIAAGLLELYLSAVGQRTNEIMRVLTVISAIFIPLTFLAGVYGMNFDNMPGLHSNTGFVVCVVLMLAIAAFQIAFFKRRGWL
jgi:magnesium transporter